jgi:hypothetical protein
MVLPRQQLTSRALLVFIQEARLSLFAKVGNKLVLGIMERICGMVAPGQRITQYPKLWFG